MSIKIKVYVLSHVHDGELHEPEAFPTQALAYKAMAKQFADAVDEFSSIIEDETAIFTDEAKIVSSDDFERWTISETELEISDLHTFATVFENYLSSYVSGQFMPFVQKAPASLRLAEELTAALQEMKTLLQAALPEFSAAEFGGGRD